jgi:hypothetical protein
MSTNKARAIEAMIAAARQATGEEYRDGQAELALHELGQAVMARPWGFEFCLIHRSGTPDAFIRLMLPAGDQTFCVTVHPKDNDITLADMAAPYNHLLTASLLEAPDQTHYTIRFWRTEEVEVEMKMTIRHEDVQRVRAMDRDELIDWIDERTTAGPVGRDYYELDSGDECMTDLIDPLKSANLCTWLNGTMELEEKLVEDES